MPGFLARSKKAIAGGFAGALTAASGVLTVALTGGTDIVWATVASVAAGGFVVGFAAVWAAPANATVPDVDVEAAPAEHGDLPAEEA